MPPLRKYSLPSKQGLEQLKALAEKPEPTAQDTRDLAAMVWHLSVRAIVDMLIDARLIADSEIPRDE
jgi:hypothetical protein